MENEFFSVVLVSIRRGFLFLLVLQAAVSDGGTICVSHNDYFDYVLNKIPIFINVDALITQPES